MASVPEYYRGTRGNGHLCKAAAYYERYNLVW